MAKFTASERLSELHFDFGEFAPEDLRPLRGTIPEPSRRQVIDFNEALARGLESLGYEIDDKTDRVHINKLYANLKVDELYQLHDHTLDAVAAVTSNTPPREHLERLGNRALTSFQEWLQSELNNPEAPAPASKR